MSPRQITFGTRTKHTSNHEMGTCATKASARTSSYPPPPRSLMSITIPPKLEKRPNTRTTPPRHILNPNQLLLPCSNQILITPIPPAYLNPARHPKTCSHRPTRLWISYTGARTCDMSTRITFAADIVWQIRFISRTCGCMRSTGLYFRGRRFLASRRLRM